MTKHSSQLQEATYIQEKANIDINGKCGKGVSPEHTVNWRCAYLQQKVWNKVSQPSTWWMPF
jgi:hypothetical protein